MPRQQKGKQAAQSSVSHTPCMPLCVRVYMLASVPVCPYIGEKQGGWLNQMAHTDVCF